MHTSHRHLAGPADKLVCNMEGYFLLSPGIERQVAIAGDLRPNLRLLEVDEAVLNEIVSRGYPFPELPTVPSNCAHGL